MWLRQSTASQEILLGTFLDSTDGDTPMTALTIANTDIKLWFEGATTKANKNSGGATHISGGDYYAVLDATDTATLGKCEVLVHVAGALAVRRSFMILPPAVYDALVLGTDYLQVDVTQVNGVAAATSDGTAQAGAASTITLASGASATNSIYVDRTVTITGGTGVGQSRVISAYVGSTKVATVHRSWNTNPDNTSTYSIGSTAASNVVEWLGAAPSALISGRVDANTQATAAALTFGLTGNITGNLSGSAGSVTAGVTVTTNNDKTGYSLASTGLDSVAITEPVSVATMNTFPKRLMAMFCKLFHEQTMTSSAEVTKNSAGTQIATQSLSDNGTTQTRGDAT